MKVLSLYFIVFLIGVSVCSGQSGSIQLKVVSGDKLLFTGEQGKLEGIFLEHFSIRKRELKDRIAEIVGEYMKTRTKQGLRDLTISFGHPIFSVYKDGSDAMVSIVIPGNSVSYYITTADYLGIGKDRSEDPFISFKYTIKGSLKITQKGDAESIEFGSPNWWYFQVDENKSKNVEGLGWSKWIETDNRNMVGKIINHFNILNEVKDKFNYYLDENIIENKTLQKELLIDENDKLEVNVHGDKTLVFNHEHSSAGILKRSTSTDASKITEKVNTSTTVPSSTNAGDINKKPASTTPPPTKTPNSTKPGDLKKGPLGTKKNPPKI